MKLEELRDAMQAAPFRPFVIRIPDGGPVEVPHPDFIAIMGNRTVIVTAPTDARPSYRLIDLPLIAQILGNAPGGMSE